MGDIDDVHGCVCTVSDFRSAAHTSQLQCQLGLQCECSQFGYSHEGRTDEVRHAASVNHCQGFAAIDICMHHKAGAQFGGDQRPRTRGTYNSVHTHGVPERTISSLCCWSHCHHLRARPIGQVLLRNGIAYPNCLVFAKDIGPIRDDGPV